MPKMTLSGHNERAFKAACPGLDAPGHVTRPNEAIVEVDCPEAWTVYAVDERYHLYAARQDRRWRFIVTDPAIGSYILQFNPANCRAGKLTLNLPDTPDGRHRITQLYQTA